MDSLLYGGNLTPTANDHTGNFDGQNIQVDLNYGNKIGKKKEVSITLLGLLSLEMLLLEQEQKAEIYLMLTMQ